MSNVSPCPNCPWSFRAQKSLCTKECIRWCDLARPPAQPGSDKPTHGGNEAGIAAAGHDTSCDCSHARGRRSSKTGNSQTRHVHSQASTLPRDYRLSKRDTGCSLTPDDPVRSVMWGALALSTQGTLLTNMHRHAPGHQIAPKHLKTPYATDSQRPQRHMTLHQPFSDHNGDYRRHSTGHTLQLTRRAPTGRCGWEKWGRGH